MPTVVNVVSATTYMYHSAMEFLKPTPAKSHYNFNMRDFSRVINGHLLLKKESAESKKTFVKYVDLMLLVTILWLKYDSFEYVFILVELFYEFNIWI